MEKASGKQSAEREGERGREGEREREGDKVGFPLFQRKRFHTQFAYCASCLCAAVIVHEPRGKGGVDWKCLACDCRIKYAN